MQRFVIEIPEDKVNFFMELLENLGLNEVKKIEAEQKAGVNELEKSSGEVTQHQPEKTESQSVKNFLKEL